jgi:hypothetical protein
LSRITVDGSDNQHKLPLPFHYKDIYQENHNCLNKNSFIICSMFTPNESKYYSYADRLAHSCEKLKLPFSIYEVPKLHKSISSNGDYDLAYTKANFIFFNMERFPSKNILYLDVDVLFMEYPSDIDEISKSNYDFAVYNWLNDEHNEAYMPINGKLEVGNPSSEYYVFSHYIGYFSLEQLICSGAVQFYSNSNKAKYLLELWQTVIAEIPDYQDDESLDYTFNNFILNEIDIKLFWLNKSYIRNPWWPHVKPVILHPAIPSAGRRYNLTELNNRKRIYVELCKKKSNQFYFPQDYIIDTRRKLLLKIIDDEIINTKPISQDFWIYPELC